MKRVLSGIQPSGQLHLGNYFGMMQRMIRYQEENDLFCCIVNYHALTTLHDAAKLSENTLLAAIDFIALGMDPEKSTFWIQRWSGKRFGALLGSLLVLLEAPWGLCWWSWGLLWHHLGSQTPSVANFGAFYTSSASMLEVKINQT